MSTASHFYKKVLSDAALAQVIFDVAVLERYIAQRVVSRTNTVGRVKAATWSIDFGIAPDEQTIHVSVQALQRLPEGERQQWLEHLHASHFSENFLKMQGSHACIDDGGFRAWGEEPLF
jgi:truncated hemoglobin YjbI